MEALEGKKKKPLDFTFEFKVYGDDLLRDRAQRRSTSSNAHTAKHSMAHPARGGRTLSTKGRSRRGKGSA